MRPSTVICLLLSGCFLSACKQDDGIQTYRVSKETDTPMAAMSAPTAIPNGAPDMMAQGSQMGLKADGSSKDIQWKTPAGWTEQPASSMRVGSFLISGANGQQAEVSIIPLSGEAGGDLANINRWRTQINLEPITDENLPQQSEWIKPAGRRMRLVDFVSSAPMIDNIYKKRLVAAIYTQGSRSWFFKMMGDDATVESAKPAFLTFLKSLHFAAD